MPEQKDMSDSETSNLERAVVEAAAVWRDVWKQHDFELSPEETQLMSAVDALIALREKNLPESGYGKNWGHPSTDEAAAAIDEDDGLTLLVRSLARFNEACATAACEWPDGSNRRRARR